MTPLATLRDMGKYRALRWRTADTGARLGLALLLLLSAGAVSLAQESGQNDANNPLTPKLSLNLQDYYDPSLFGLPGRDANQFLLRGLIPAKLFDVPQLFRYTMPIASAPRLPGGNVTGLGDLTLQDIFVIPGKPVSFGFGPLVVLPTATDNAVGAGKWQAGPLALAIAPQSWGLIGALATYQHSFAGEGGRPDTSLLTAQPILFYNLPEGYYLRSSGTWNFDFANNTRSIPIGAGLGKVWDVGEGVAMNTFAEPQYTVWRHGNGLPRWQVFAGINFQIPLGHPH